MRKTMFFCFVDILVDIRLMRSFIILPRQGPKGPVEHIYRGILFIYDRNHHMHYGYICVKSESCVVVGGGGLRANDDINDNTRMVRFPRLRTSFVPQSPLRPPRGDPMNFGRKHERARDALVGAAVKIRTGNYKGYKGCVVEVKGSVVRVELESQMKVVAVDRSHISDNMANGSTPFRYENAHARPRMESLHTNEGLWFFDPKFRLNNTSSSGGHCCLIFLSRCIVG
ncbi:transcription elongation factor SPT5 [Striga asiatica]|uniref:Transcription elongation factor SPT5 n=1 Tax=Striga asiatica TaxID=4170 RepID=A0A5A7Q4N8_STRAF|nr:transcription elongation factor SPT5 [Striga asiatica]